jgi:hypothetical protein
LALASEEIRALKAFQRKTERQIYVPIKYLYEESWNIRASKELQGTLQGVDIVRYKNCFDLHFVRMNSERMPKRIETANVEGIRKEEDCETYKWMTLQRICR